MDKLFTVKLIQKIVSENDVDMYSDLPVICFKM